MKKYKIGLDCYRHYFYSNSKNAKKHLIDNGGNSCEIYENDILIKHCIRLPDGTFKNLNID